MREEGSTDRTPEKVVQDIRRKTRRQFPADFSTFQVAIG